MFFFTKSPTSFKDCFYSAKTLKPFCLFVHFVGSLLYTLLYREATKKIVKGKKNYKSFKTLRKFKIMNIFSFFVQLHIQVSP